MTTTVDLNDRELRDLCEVTQQTDVALAVRTAMTEYIRYVRRQQLMELSGKVEMGQHPEQDTTLQRTVWETFRVPPGTPLISEDQVRQAMEEEER